MVRVKKFVRTLFSHQFSSFTYLNITQFLGALNDNIYKLLIVFFLIQQWGISESPLILSTTGAVFVLPFLLFSTNSGTLADRFSKRNIIVLTKILELLVMSIGMLSFAFESAIGSYITLFMMATQSAIFGPSKYGIIPELVQTEKISSANGLLTSFTFLAIIIGTFLASFMTDITDYNFVVASLTCAMISLAGVIMSFGIEYTPPAGSQKRLSIRLFTALRQTMKQSYEIPSLAPCIIGSCFFLFLGAFVQLNMIPYAVESLGLTDVQGGYLFLLTALGIGTGSILAGKISGKTVELGLVPIASIGIMFSLFALDFFSFSLPIILVLMVIVGMLGGIYQIPLDSYIQVASPNDIRGQVVATTNFLSFTGVLAASGAIYLFSAVFGLKAHQSFGVLGFFAAFVALYYAIHFSDYLIRLIGMVLSKFIFKVEYEGAEELPEPAVFVSNTSCCKDLLLLFGLQRLRLRFLLLEGDSHFTPSKFTSLLFGIRRVKTPEELLKKVEAYREQNFSLCLLISSNQKEELHKVVQNSPIAMLPLTIETNKKPGRNHARVSVGAAL